MKNIYSKEMTKLATGLVERGIEFKFRPFYEGCQIIVDDWGWDAICHEFSYGSVEGLLEVSGEVSRTEDVEGWLTAEEILKRVDEEK